MIMGWWMRTRVQSWAAKNSMTTSIGEYYHPKINGRPNGLKEEGLSLKLKGSNLEGVLNVISWATIRVHVATRERTLMMTIPGMLSPQRICSRETCLVKVVAMIVSA